MKKRLLSLVLCLVMVFSLLPFAGFADDLTPADTTGDGLVLSKDLVPQKNGSYDLQLEAYATGKPEAGSQTANTQFDIAVVVDQSSSMAINDIGGEWVKVKDGNNQEKTSWTIEEAAGYYYKVGDEYYPVKAMPGTIYETVPAPRIWRMIGSGHDGFTIGANGAPTHFNVPTDYYCIGSDGKPHKVWIVTAGMFLEYYAYPYYYLNDNDPIAQKAEWQNNIYWLVGVSDWDGRDLTKLTSKGLGWPTAGVQSGDFKTLVDAHRINFLGQTELTNATAKACRKTYSWFTDGDAVDGLVLPKTGTNYNQLGYVDANGNLVKIPESNTIYTEGSTVYNGNLYTRDGDVTRMQALQAALSLFTHNVAADADARGVTHNIAMVGFADNKPEGYTNTELFANGTENNYSTLNNGLYANAFIPLNENDNNGNLVNDTFDSYIGMLDTEGYTYTSYGVAMANQIFANNPIPAGDNTRQRILIIFTDGEPGKYGYDPAIANEALADAQIAKDVYGTKVYTIALYNGKLETQVENFMKYLTSEYSTATSNVYASSLNSEQTYYYTSTVDGKTYAASAIRNGLSTLDWWIDNGDGTYTWTSPKNETSSTQGEDQREGTVYFYKNPNSSGAVYADGSGSSAVSTSSTYYTADNKQIRYELRWYNSDGDFVDPKTSASDSNARHQQFFSIGASTKIVGEDEHYFLPVTNDAEIQAAFDAVTTKEVPVVNIVSATELGASAELKDFISDSFDVPANPTITVQTAVGTADAQGNISWSAPADSSLTATYSNGTVSLTGFDYKTNFVAYGKPAIENDTAENQGRKIIVTIKGLTPKANATGTIYSNTDASGVYDGNTLKAAFPMPSIEVGTVPTYVVDYAAKMQLATEAKQMKGETHNNGAFDLSNEKVTYQLTTQAQSDKTAVINTAYATVDTALVYGIPSNQDGAVKAWNQITTVPASSVYYDDSFTAANAQVVTPGDTVNQTGTIDASGKYYFTFYGTGIDVYCTTHEDGGYITAAVFKASNPSECTTATRVGKAASIRNYSSADYYNTPSASFTTLEGARVYTLMIMASEGAQYKLDGVRVYNPVQADSAAAAELNETDEANANYFNLHELLLNESSTFSALSTTAYGELTGEEAAAVSGVLYLDNADIIVMTSNDADGNPQKIYQNQFEVYKTNSPKNEIYLQNGQGVAFKLNKWSADSGEKVYLGVSAPQGSGTVVINKTEKQISSSVDQYYDITDLITDGVVSIKTKLGNTNVISLTNLKITGVSLEDIVAQDVPVDSTNNLNSFKRLAFAPMMMSTVQSIADTTVLETSDPAESDPQPTAVPDPEPTPLPSDDPAPSAEPVVPSQEPVNPTPSIASIIQQIFSNFVNSLFGSIARLFGN